MKDSHLAVYHRLLRWAYSPVRTNTPASQHRMMQHSNHRSVLAAPNKSALVLSAVGMCAVLTGLFILLANPYDIIYRWKCTFGEGGEIFELWRTPPVDLYLRVFLWNVTNRDEFLSGEDDQLQLEQVGPYVYKEMFIHDNVTFNDNGTLTAIPKHPLVWVPELSEGHAEDDLLILPNIALLSIAQVASRQSYFTRLGLNLVIRQTKTEPLTEMTAHEFMFGYESTLMTLGNKFMPSWIYFDKLGLIDRMYDFDGDFETIYTGETDLAMAGLVDTYRGSQQIPQWESPCGDVQNASDGTKFRGYLKPNDTLRFFRKSMCRAKDLVHVGDTVNSGLPAYVYHFTEDADDNGANNTNNTCFCDRKYTCLPPGLLDVHGCYYGFPIALSYPHFFGANESVLGAKVRGHHANADEHQTYFVIEPQSGLPLDLAVRYQINMALGDIGTIANVKRFSHMVLPLLWTETRLYRLPDMLAARFRLYLSVLPVVEQALMYTSFVMGLILVAVAMRKLIRSSRHTSGGHRSTGSFRNQWMDDEMGGATLADTGKKMSTYMTDRRTSMTANELDTYFSSLITPLNQELDEDGDEGEEEDENQDQELRRNIVYRSDD